MSCLALLAAASAYLQAGAVDAPQTVPLSNLPLELIYRLADMSARYEDQALRFMCRETIRRSSYDVSGDPNPPKRQQFD